MTGEGKVDCFGVDRLQGSDVLYLVLRTLTEEEGRVSVELSELTRGPGPDRVPIIHLQGPRLVQSETRNIDSRRDENCSDDIGGQRKRGQPRFLCPLNYTRPDQMAC